MSAHADRSVVDPGSGAAEPAPSQGRAWPLSGATTRTLTRLQETGSTSRVLSLPAIWKRHHENPEYWEKPLFQHPTLNTAFLIKHTLRGSEQDLFEGAPRSATKLLVPMDYRDLGLGGRYLFIGQKGYDGLLRDLLGGGDSRHANDRNLLELLDQIPSLDPFLMREQLRRHGIEAATCYFEVSEADMKRMFAFVKAEIEPLMSVAFGDLLVTDDVDMFATKILSSQIDAEMDLLRTTFRLSPSEYREGMFCWKGFLYYKWTLAETVPAVHAALREMEAMEPSGKPGADKLVLLAQARASLKRAVSDAAAAVKETVGVYNDAYEKLTRFGRPTAFRRFLLDAPLLFDTLGANLGALNHIHSFWRFRFPVGEHSPASAEELLSIMSDFQAGLGRPARSASAQP